jgi:putative NADH-flavin reductase
MNDSVIDNITTTQPKILVLGATGGTGRLIVSQALERGYDVAALVRSPEKAGDLKGAKLIVGDARDEMALLQALQGREAVVSALGTPASPFREVTFLSTATRALVSAMKSEQVSRLVAVTGIGAGDSAGHGGFVFDRLIFPLLLRKVYADKNRQEAIIRDSGLDWVLVRPSVLNDKARHDPRAHGSRPISRGDHIAGRRCEICVGPRKRQHMAASLPVDHMVKTRRMVRLVVAPIRNCISIMGWSNRRTAGGIRDASRIAKRRVAVIEVPQMGPSQRARKLIDLSACSAAPYPACGKPGPRSTSSPAQSGRDVLEDGFDNMGVVRDPQLVRHSEEQRVGLGDRFVRP